MPIFRFCKGNPGPRRVGGARKDAIMVSTVGKGNQMKRIAFFIAVLLLLGVSPAHAGPTVKCKIEKVSEHKHLVTFMWNLTVASDKHWDACDMAISFRDPEGLEIYRVEELLKIKVGNNAFTGHEILDIETWKQIRESRATLDCVF